LTSADKEVKKLTLVYTLYYIMYRHGLRTPRNTKSPNIVNMLQNGLA